MVSAVPFPSDVPYTSAIDSARAGADYASKLFEQAKAQKLFQQQQAAYQSQLQAGQAFAGGDYSGTSSALAQGGDVQGAEQAQTYGIQQHQMQFQYMQQATQVLQGIWQKTNSADAVVQAFDHISPELTQLGVSPQMTQQVRQSLAQDPQGTLQAVGAIAMKQFDYQQDPSGNVRVINKLTGQLDHIIPGQQKPIPVPYGTRGFYTPDSGAVPSPAQDGAPPAAMPQGPAGGDASQQGLLAGPPNAAPPVGRAALNLAQNNPGNLKVPGSNTQFQTFATPQDGVDAVGHQLERYRARGADTIAEIVSKYAPPNVDGNNTAAYIASVSKATGIPANRQLADGDVPAVRDAMISFEQGRAAPTAAAPQQTAQASGPTTTQLPGGGTFTDFGGNAGSAPVQPIAPGSPEAQMWPGAAGIDRRTGHPIYQPAALLGTEQFTAAEQLINNGVKGQQLFNSLPPTLQGTVKQLVEGRIQFPSTFALRQPYWQKMIQVANAVDPSLDASNYPARAATRVAFDKGKQGDIVRSFNVAVQHLGVLRPLIAALQNGNVQAFNRAAQAWNEQTGSAAPTNMDAASQIVANEMAKAVIGNSGAYGDRESINKTLANYKAKNQLTGAVNTYLQLSAGQVKGLRQQWVSSMGPNSGSEFDAKLLPETKQALAAVQPRGNGAPARGGQQPKVIDFNSLPK